MTSSTRRWALIATLVACVAGGSWSPTTSAQQGPSQQESLPPTNDASSEENMQPETGPQYGTTRRANTDKQTPIERLNIDLESGAVEERVARLLAVMTLEEKIGQLCQVAPGGETLADDLADDIRHGRVGSVFYTGHAEQTREAQRVATQESRLGLWLLTPRDVIHGFRTVFPIPLGQAASWNPELVRRAARIAAEEARVEGVNWTFAPMLDISRDARWGRIAESLGEDPQLASTLGAAMVVGFQGDNPARPVLAACAKHFVAYGLTEGGRDYNRSMVSINELHNTFLPPFRAALDAGCLTLMTGFSSVNGVPPTGSRELVGDLLKRRWGFDGLVVSDWGSVVEMIEHGYAADSRDAAQKAIAAGVDMEMASETYRENLLELVEAGETPLAEIDEAVRRVLRLKLRVGPPRESTAALNEPAEESLAAARELATQSVVLLKNRPPKQRAPQRGQAILPLDPAALRRVAVVGPLANAARDQLGCWMLDGKPEEAITPLEALRNALPEAEVTHAPALDSSTDTSEERFEQTLGVVSRADVAIAFVGEDWWLSGEARSRADLNLPGAQPALVRALAQTDTPLVLVVLAGRPLTIGHEATLADAVLYAWHPGTMGGPAIADLLLGAASPSGKLPLSFPKHVGQSPLYYNHPRTGRPAQAEVRALIGSDRSDFPEEMKYRSHYLDVDPFPLYPFGYGLSYTTFGYSELAITTAELRAGQTLTARCRLTNTGDHAGAEIVQLYTRDVAASLVRPVRELQAFRRVTLAAGESTELEFELPAERLAFFDNRGESRLEPGEFRLWIGGDSAATLGGAFELVDGPATP
ncbi:glycoside hydrolase family 3 N-terminal domain-containing protein [Pseudobythopirellula maris]|nr:glycoside hydrolase family 3 N-terminal domain-containing protein [Pseudobythopirellula maris]